MSVRGRSASPNARGADMDVDDVGNKGSVNKPDARVVVVTNLTRNIVEYHLRTVFGFYGHITKVDLPLFGNSGQNRGKALLEYTDAAAAHRAAEHMNGGQLDGAVVKVELSDQPIRPAPRARSRTRSRSPVRRSPPPRAPRGRSPSRSRSRSPIRSPRYGTGPRRGGGAGGYRDRYDPPPSYRGRGGRGGRGPPPPHRRTSRSRSRSRSPTRRPGDRAVPPRRRSPSYERGGYSGRGRSRSRSFDSVRSSRSRTPSRSRSPRSRSRSPRDRSYSPYSRYSSSRSRSPRRRSPSPNRVRRSPSRDDIRDSRSRSASR